MTTDMQRGQNTASGLIPMLLHVTSGLENPLEYWAAFMAGMSGAMAAEVGTDAMRTVLMAIVEMPDIAAEIKKSKQH